MVHEPIDPPLLAMTRTFARCKKDGVEMAKGFLVNAVQGLEFLNDSYDPFGLKLNGFSELHFTFGIFFIFKNIIIISYIY